jgi:acylphosphatase
MTETLKSVYIIVTGKVQGVYFRAFTKSQADRLEIKGRVKNLTSGNQVEVIAEGRMESLQELIAALKKGPAGARVDNLEISWSDECTGFNSFEIDYQDSKPTRATLIRSRYSDFKPNN